MLFVYEHKYVNAFIPLMSCTLFSMCVLHVDGQSCEDANYQVDEWTGICPSSVHSHQWRRHIPPGSSRQNFQYNTRTSHQWLSQNCSQSFSTHAYVKCFLTITVINPFFHLLIDFIFQINLRFLKVSSSIRIITFQKQFVTVTQQSNKLLSNLYFNVL